jgi:hypothetical protein
MPKTIAGAATQIDIADHCMLRFIWGAIGARSKIFCLEEFALEASSFQKNNMYNTKSAKIVPASNGPAFRNRTLATATMKPMATNETRHQLFTAAGILFEGRAWSFLPSEINGSSGISVFQKAMIPNPPAQTLTKIRNAPHLPRVMKHGLVDDFIKQYRQ